MRVSELTDAHRKARLVIETLENVREKRRKCDKGGREEGEREGGRGEGR